MGRHICQSHGVFGHGYLLLTVRTPKAQLGQLKAFGVAADHRIGEIGVGTTVLFMVVSS